MRSLGRLCGWRTSVPTNWATSVARINWQFGAKWFADGTRSVPTTLARKKNKHEIPARDAEEAAAPPRIIGGKFRGRKLLYSGDRRIRPMKERVRESLFNLIGPAVVGKHAIDLFAGTGALGLEALSRGAVSATFVERHFPTAEIVRQNAAALEVEQLSTIMPANVLLWSKRMPELPDRPWLVFVSPPWDLFIEQAEAIVALIQSLLERAPPESIFVVEADERFDFRQLPQVDQWDVREYPPAVIGILKCAQR
jgi:16S rRNA (guanine966-N2)-methyltransferase